MLDVHFVRITNLTTYLPEFISHIVVDVLKELRVLLVDDPEPGVRGVPRVLLGLRAPAVPVPVPVREVVEGSYEYLTRKRTV